MDGHFVPPITIGPLIAASIADQVHDAGGALDVHLMIERPEQQIEEFAKAGADCITFHAEATAHANRTLARSASSAASPGWRSTPAPPVEAIAELAAPADLLLCMTVNPGWGGQPFIASSPGKVERLRAQDPSAVIEVDGGIDAEHRRRASPTPAPTLFVAGSAVFGADDPAAAYREIAAAAGAE